VGERWLHHHGLLRRHGACQFYRGRMAVSVSHNVGDSGRGVPDDCGRVRSYEQLTENKMLFDLINMSDKYTFVADDLEIAALTTCLLGSGQYGADQLDGDAKVPIFLLGGSDEWFTAKFGRNLEQSLNALKASPALIDCLESVLIGDRREYDETLPMIAEDKRDEWIAAWHDRHRSSLNDIGGRAKRIAKALAEKERPEPAPQQVFVA